MKARLLWASAAALALTGCYTVACVEPDPVYLEVCHERLASVFDDAPSSPFLCRGQEETGSCAGQGFTEPCGAVWLKPGIPCR
jgi:hypothetical protein